MGIIRGGVFVVLCVLFFGTLLVGNFFWTLNSSMDIDVIKPQLMPIISEKISEQVNFNSLVANNIEGMNDYCDVHTNFNYTFEGIFIKIPCRIIKQGEDSTYSFVITNNSKIISQNKEETFKQALSQNYVSILNYCNEQENYFFKYDNETVSISCNTIDLGVDAVVAEVLEDTVDNFYFKKYSCQGFFSCVSKSKGLFLISEQSRDYYSKWFYYSLVAALILFILLIIIGGVWTSTLIVSGILASVSALPFLKFDSILAFFVPKNFEFILSVFMSGAISVFMKVFILGIFLILLGVGFKISHVANWISEKFGSDKKTTSGDVRQIVREETGKKD
jgi:CRISPR/Cas system CMR-associated protein Cmr5 small subunit